MKNVLKNIRQANLLLEDLGKSLTKNEIVHGNITLFVLRFKYNDKKSLSLAESCCKMWKRMKNKSTQRLPPDKDTMRGYIYQGATM